MIRDYTAADADQVVALNAANQPEVGDMDQLKLAGFADWAPYLRVVDVEGEIVAFLIGLDNEADYGSLNYAWFMERLDNFAYIDRIAVAEAHRGQGWGPALYNDFEKWARDRGSIQLCAEVNVVPPNPRSVRFHEIFGFQALSEFEPTGSPDYRVVMLAKPLD